MAYGRYFSLVDEGSDEFLKRNFSIHICSYSVVKVLSETIPLTAAPEDGADRQRPTAEERSKAARTRERASKMLTR